MESTRWSSTHEDRKASLHQVDGAFFNKIIARNPSIDLSYDQECNPIAGVPFDWESQPGIPREDPRMNETIRPINLPPALHGSTIPKPNTTHTGSRVLIIKKMKKIQRYVKDQAKHLSAKIDRYVTGGATNNKIHSEDNQGYSRPTDDFALENLDVNDDVFAHISRNSSLSSWLSSALKRSCGGMKMSKSLRFPKSKVRSTLDGMSRKFARFVSKEV